MVPRHPRKIIVQWLWAILLSDGRQIAVLAHSTTGHHDEAEQILQQTTPAEPWEHALAACLHAINRTPDDPAIAAQMTGTYLAINDPGHAMFTVRLGLTTAELSDDPGGQRPSSTR